MHSGLIEKERGFWNSVKLITYRLVFKWLFGILVVDNRPNPLREEEIRLFGREKVVLFGFVICVKTKFLRDFFCN